MDPVKSIVKPLTETLTKDGWAVPLAVTVGFQGFHKVHRLWRWNRRIRDVTDQSGNFEKLVAGHLLQWVVGDPLLLRVAAQTILVARRILDCALQQMAFGEAYRQCKVALLQPAWPTHDVVVGEVPPALRKIVSPSSWLRWNLRIRRLIAKVESVIWRTGLFFREGFRLSMCYMDAIEALSLTQEQGRESINELFINTSRTLEELVVNKTLILEELDTHKPLIRRLLKRVHASFTEEELTEGVRKALDKTELLYHVQSHLPEQALRQGSYAFLYTTLGWAPASLAKKDKGSAFLDRNAERGV